MHRVPTTMLHNLEGLSELDWTMLLKLQSSDGSFLFSPSATAYAFMQTGDRKCFEYIDRIVKKFNGGGKTNYEARNDYIPIRLQGFLSRPFIINCLCPPFSVPGVYPVDLFEHLWVVDRLQRLGVSHHFKREIEQSMDYVNRFLFCMCLYNNFIV